VDCTHLNFSDYIVYVDESGDHSLQSIDASYPLFVLTFCVFEKKYYSHVVTPSLRMLKFMAFGHDMVVLHERDIRRKTGAFHALNRKPRESFLEAITDLIAHTDFTLLSIVIDKYRLKKQDAAAANTYHLAMQFGLEKLYHFLQSRSQQDRLTHIVFEARGKAEDAALEFEFQRVCNQYNSLQTQLPFKIVIANKQTNSEGLQFADMIARPVGLSVLRPEQTNRALKVLEKKFYQNSDGEKLGYGLRLYP